MQSLFYFQERVQTDDGIGGHTDSWETSVTVSGYLDLVTGTDLNQNQNARVVESTHLLIIPQFTEGLHERMRVKAAGTNRVFDVTFVDDPVNQQHHNEVYLRFNGGAAHGEG